jgi:ornithine carbamoyltransferase
MHCTVTGPSEFAPSPGLMAEARELAITSGARLEATPDLAAACREADVVYTDVWTSMGQESETQHRRDAFRDYQVNEALMRLAKPDALLLHCLPAHYGEEIDYRTSRTPNSAIFEQAENRLHAEKALILMLAGGR